MIKDHYRILLFPLKLPNTVNFFKETSANSSLPVPFLFLHLSKQLTRTNNPATGLNRRSALTRFFNWGESKWQEYGEASPRSIKGVMHRIGSVLLDRIPVTEKQLWRLHALHQHLQHTDPLELKRLKSLDIETGSVYLNDANVEQLLKFDLVTQLNHWAAYHRRWSIFSSCMILPVAILSILPFGKLFLAWIIFRAVAHWRAFQGAHFLSRCFNFDRQDRITDILPVRFVSNPFLDKHLPLPPTFTSETRGFTDPFVNLARDLDLGELVQVLPKALKLLVKLEYDKNNHQSGSKRRKFSNHNLLEP